MYGSLYSGYTTNLLSTWYYYSELVNSVQPTVQFMYDNFFNKSYYYLINIGFVGFVFIYFFRLKCGYLKVLLHIY